MKQIVPGLFYITGLPVGRVYVTQDADGLTVIDAGIPPAGSKILAQIEAAGHKRTDIKRIVITHAHPDHIGALPMLKKETGAQVIVSSGDRPVIEGEIPVVRVERRDLSGFWKLLRPPNATSPRVVVDRAVNDGDLLPEVMGGMQVIGTPGHSPGHIALWQPDQKLMIGGDVIMRLFGKLRVPLPFLTVDMAEAKRSIRKVVNMSPEIMCFGHGDPVTQNTPQVLRDFARDNGIA